MSDLFGQPKPTIKALSLWEPWATLIAVGAKRHETRHWATPHRGLLAIHASKTVDLIGAPAALCYAAVGQDWWSRCSPGCVVAVAELRACRWAHEVAETATPADLAAGNFAYGRYAWALAKVRALAEPIPTLGRQGLFNWTPPDDLQDRLGPVLDHEAVVGRIGWGRPGLDASAA